MVDTSKQKPFTNSDLGKAVGKQPALIGHMVSGNERALYRRQLKKSFGNMHINALGSSPLLYNNNVLGPFRTAYNAGDVVTRNITNTDPKYGRPPSQVGGNNLARVSGRGDGVSANGNAMYSGNPRFVYDGSDYTRFKKCVHRRSRWS